MNNLPLMKPTHCLANLHCTAGVAIEDAHGFVTFDYKQNLL